MKTLLLFFILVVLLALCVHRHGRAEMLTTEDVFVFDAGDRRDPFSFTREFPRLSVVAVVPGGDVPDAEKMDPAKIAQKRIEALTFYGLAEQAFMEDNATDTLAHCEHGLEVFKDVPMKEYRDLQE